MNKWAALKDEKILLFWKKNQPFLDVHLLVKNALILHLNILTSPACDTHSHPLTQIKCSVPPPVAKVTKPAHLLPPKSKEKHFIFSCSLCCSWGIDLYVWLTLFSPCSSPFFPFRARKEVDRNKASYSQKSPKEVPSLSLSDRGAVTSKPLSKNGGDKKRSIWLPPGVVRLFLWMKQHAELPVRPGKAASFDPALAYSCIHTHGFLFPVIQNQ